MAKQKKINNLADLTPDNSNANKGTERGRYMVEASLTEVGAGRSILVDAAGNVIAGNKTLEAWASMGGEVEVVQTDGHKLVVVQRTDLDLHDTTGKARKLAYYDNRAGQVGLEWDTEQLLADVNAGVDLSAMFKDDELKKLIADAGGDNPLGGMIPEGYRYTEQYGVIVICGSSADQERIYGELTGGGYKCKVVVT